VREFTSVADCVGRLDAADYLIDPEAATVAYLATRMEKPVLVEGPAGVGKTELARALSRALGRELVRLQCYEGLDEAKALYEWEYAKQLLYTQILRDKIGDAVGDAPTLGEAIDRIARQDDVFFSDRFLLPRPLLRAILSEQPVVLLIDEIDKGDAEFEAFRGLPAVRAALDGLEVAVRVAVASAEAPSALLDAADIVVESPAEFLALLRKL